MHSRSKVRLAVILGLALGASQVSAQSVSGMTAAVRAHDVATVQSLLKQGADVNAADVDGTTPLMLAVQERDAAMIEALLQAGAQVDTVNRYGATALHAAARNGDTRAVQLLLSAGANHSMALPEGETVLMAAARTGNVDVINALLAAGADANFRETWKGQTALMWAAAEGHGDAVRALVAAGARTDEFSAQISVPEVNPDRRIGGFVYAQIPKGRMTALHFAARGGHLDAARALIDAGADLNAVDAEGTNAMILATLNGHPDVAVALMEAGADVNVADRWGRTILFVGTDMNTLDANPRPAPVVTGEKTYLDVVTLALAKGADPNAKLKSNLPSWVAQGGGHNPMLREGATTFLRAAMSGDLTVMNLLLEAGADPAAATADEYLKPYSEGGPDRENFGKSTALQAAAGVGWREEVSRGRDQDAIEAIRLLLAKGGDINQANTGGNTPLHGAAMRGSPAIVKFLLEQGADPTLRNARGMTAMDIALGNPDYRILPNEAVATVLRDHVAGSRLSSTR